MSPRFVLLALLAPLMFAVSAPSADAAGWRSSKLRSQQGLEISVDHEVRVSGGGSYKPSYDHHATPLFVNVRGAGLTRASRLRVVLNNWQHQGGALSRPGSIPETYVLDLQPSESAQYGFHFSGNLEDAHVTQGYLDHGRGAQHPLLAGVSGYGGTRVFQQTLSLVHDGDWQRDPISGSHDFDLRLGLGPLP